VSYIGFEKEYYALPLARTTSAEFAYAQWHDGEGSFYLSDATDDEIIFRNVYSNTLRVKL
jgi:hypothetical protein